MISRQAHCLPQCSFYVAALAVNRGFLRALILGHSCSKEGSGYDALRETFYNDIFFSVLVSKNLNSNKATSS